MKILCSKWPFCKIILSWEILVKRLWPRKKIYFHIGCKLLSVWLRVGSDRNHGYQGFQFKANKKFFWSVFDIWGTDSSEKNFKNVEFSKNVKNLHLLCSVQCHSHEMKVPSLFHSQCPKINTFWVISDFVKNFLILPFFVSEKWAITFYILFQSLNVSRNFDSYGHFRAACTPSPKNCG